VGCKSILAYRYGFDVDPTRPSPAQVGVATERWLTQRARDRAARRITDPVLLRHALWCGVDAGLPVQLHTGFGDPEEDLHRANPALLAGFCRATEHTGTAIVLLHCYPYHREAAWLAHSFQHVYLDVGLASTYVGYRASALLAEVLELAPFGKVLYSSDAFGLPELYLVAARAFRRAVSEVLGGWQHSGEAAEADVPRIAQMIAEENARRLYRLPVAA
jgi:predicted TIM-barrel fold metal-dependent hydrolase